MHRRDVAIIGLLSILVSLVSGRLVRAQSADDGFNPGANGVVRAVVVQADGKILVGGELHHAGRADRATDIGRLNADGTLDTDVQSGGGRLDVNSAGGAGGREDSGGRLLHHAGRAAAQLHRPAECGRDAGQRLIRGRTASCHSLAVQADGKILVGGNFTTLGGQPRNYIGRLNADGTLDSGFNPGANSCRVFAGGAGGREDSGGRRLHHAGRADAQPHRPAQCGRDPGQRPSIRGRTARVYSLAVQADGKILVGGDFTTLGGQPRNYIGRLERGRHAGHGLQSGGERLLSYVAGGAGGREDPGGRRLHHAGRAAAQLHRPAQPGRHAGHGLQSGGERCCVIRWRCRRTGRSWWGADSPRWAGSRATTSAGSTPDGTLDSDFNPGADSTCRMPWRCRRTARSWWGATSPRWAGSRAATSGGSTRMARWTRPSTQGRTVDVIRLAVQADGKIVVGG